MESDGKWWKVMESDVCLFLILPGRMGTVATDSDVAHIGPEPPSNLEKCTKAPRCCGDAEFVHVRAARLCVECRTGPWGPRGQDGQGCSEFNWNWPVCSLPLVACCRLQLARWGDNFYWGGVNSTCNDNAFLTGFSWNQCKPHEPQQFTW